ncbi:MAG: hypothetical protein IJ666_09030 [Ruminococcus sp.]|nr:hypothetical protein [Ruminococcus sp.]
MMSVIPNVVLVAAESADWHGITQTSLNGVFEEIYNLLPIILPAIIGWLGFRKAWAFIRGAIKGA